MKDLKQSGFVVTKQYKVLEIHFDLHRCIYNDLTKEYEFPELCTVFCENDDIAFNGLMPKIRFERNGTLGQGMNKCDFHLINNRKKNR